MTRCALSTHHQSSDTIYSNQTQLDTLTAAASAHQSPFTRRCSDIPARTTQRSAFLRVALGSTSHHTPLFTLGEARAHTHARAPCSVELISDMLAAGQTKGENSRKHTSALKGGVGGVGWGGVGCGAVGAVMHAAASAPRPLC